jgi:hypothetical protein
MHVRQGQKQIQRVRSNSVATAIVLLSLFDAVMNFCQRAERCGAKRRRLSHLRGIAYSSSVHSLEQQALHVAVYVFSCCMRSLGNTSSPSVCEKTRDEDKQNYILRRRKIDTTALVYGLRRG